MQKITVEYMVYGFDELSEQSQVYAINELIGSVSEVPELYPELEDELEKANKKANEMQTPWFFGEYVLEYAKDKLYNILKGGRYLENGKYFSEGDKL